MLKITYNPEHDIKNWLRIKKNDGEDFVITQYYPFDRSIPVSQDQSDQIVQSLPIVALQRFFTQAKELEQVWKDLDSKVMIEISAYFHCSLQSINAKADLTTAYRMPYDVEDSWFMIPTHKSQTQQLRVILHEFFHLYHLQVRPETSREVLERTAEEFLLQQKII